MAPLRGVFAHTLAIVVVTCAAAPVHARAVRAPRPEAPRSDYIPAAADVGDEPRTDAVPIAGSGLTRGRSTVTIHAPLARVRDTVFDFAHYADFMPHYESAKVLGPTPSGGRDVYMRITALNGIVKMWARIAIDKPVIEDGAEVYRSHFVDGNIRDLQATWTFRAIDDAITDLTVEVMMQPKLPLPDSVLNNENLKGAREAVLAFKARAEGKRMAKE